MTPVRLREATAADVPLVTALVTEVLVEFGLTFGQGAATDQQVLDLPSSYTAHGGCFWIAEAEGAARMCRRFSGRAHGVRVAQDVSSSQRAGVAGLAELLLEQALQWARQNGGKKMVLDTIDEMTRAIAFYEANGFVRDDHQIRGSRCTRGYSRAL